MAPAAVHCSAFLHGLTGLLLVIGGVFVKGDIRQTVCGFHRRTVVLDGLGGIPVPVLPTRGWGTQPGNGERWSRYATRIPHPSCQLRYVDDGDDALHLLHQERMQLHQLVAAHDIAFAQEQRLRHAR